MDDLNTMYKLFEDRDREGNGLITVDDFFFKILKINRSFYGDSLLELIGKRQPRDYLLWCHSAPSLTLSPTAVADTERAEQISFGEFVQIFSVYCLFETQDVLRCKCIYCCDINLT